MENWGLETMPPYEELPEYTPNRLAEIDLRGLSSREVLRKLGVDPDLRPSSMEYLRSGGKPRKTAPVRIYWYPEEGRHILIDGRHRISFAMEKGATEIPFEYAVNIDGYLSEGGPGVLLVGEGFVENPEPINKRLYEQVKKRNKMKKVFAIVSASGEFVDASTSESAAAAAATRSGYENVYWDKTFESTQDTMTPNPMTPQIAHKNMGNLFIDYDEAMSMSLEEAAARAIPHMPVKKVTKESITPLDNSARGLVSRIIGKNYKTSKSGEEYLGYSVYVDGLSLLPHSLWWDTLKESEIPSLPVVQGGVAAPSPRKLFTLCAGSSRECRESCLVYSGQNLNDVFNTVSKMSWTNLLMYEPLAFMRLLSERTHKNLRSRSKSMQFVRLNVLSDVPWELVCPGFVESMDQYDRREFAPIYDYTKVPGRDPGKQYDLTFSFSGVNTADCIREYDRFGRRIAVVFIDSENRPGTDYAAHPRYSEIQRKGLIAQREGERIRKRLNLGKKSFTPYLSEDMQEDYEVYRMLGTRRPVTLPRSVMLSSSEYTYEFEVVDGDIHDARPLDPPGVVVGLKYKAPKSASQQTRGKVGAGATKAGGLTRGQLAKFQRGYGREYERITSMTLGRQGTPEEQVEREMSDAFLVPAYETNDGHLITAVVPRHETDYNAEEDEVPPGYSTEGQEELSRMLQE